MAKIVVLCIVAFLAGWMPAALEASEPGLAPAFAADCPDHGGLPCEDHSADRCSLCLSCTVDLVRLPDAETPTLPEASVAPAEVPLYIPATALAFEPPPPRA